jgi:ribosomal protein S18 acetylase RimI-like enzyme
MRPLYEKCPGWGGWKPAQKRKEMEHEDARYLIAYDTMPSSSVQLENQTNNNNNNSNNNTNNNTTSSNATTPVAFVHVRFEEEHGQPICYLYEIQIASSHQSKGLGKYLMQLVELITRKGGLTRIMLTVFHENTAAVALYNKLGYVKDGDSPGVVNPTGEHGYEIMTKMMPPRKVL